jgi:translation initiation factor 3 subunit A
LIEHSKKTPKASLMAAFYEKMVRVFGVGRNYLFHAAAYSKVYSHQTPTSAVSKETEDLASAVLLSALAVPVSAGDLGKRRDHENQESRSKAARLAGLLGLPAVPTRTSLIQDAVSLRYWLRGFIMWT